MYKITKNFITKIIVVPYLKNIVIILVQCYNFEKKHLRMTIFLKKVNKLLAMQFFLDFSVFTLKVCLLKRIFISYGYSLLHELIAYFLKLVSCEKLRN